MYYEYTVDISLYLQMLEANIVESLRGTKALDREPGKFLLGTEE